MCFEKLSEESFKEELVCKCVLSIGEIVFLEFIFWFFRGDLGNR